MARQFPFAPSQLPTFATLLYLVELLVVVRWRTESPEQLVEPAKNCACAFIEGPKGLSGQFSRLWITAVGIATLLRSVLM